MTADLPDITLIIPTRQRPEQLAGCLASLRSLDYPREHLQVIVVDDGSDPPVKSVVMPYQGHLPLELVVQSGAGPAAARNRGAEAARGEFLAFTDDDCRPAADWLLRLAERLMRSPERAVGGLTLNALPENIYSSASQMLIDHLYAYYNRDPENATFLTSSNLALSRSLFRQVGGLNPNYLRAAGEDRELCDRWLQRGWKMTFASEAVVYHRHSLTLGSFWRQHWTYGRGAWHYRLDRAARERGPVRVEPPRFYTRLLARPFTTHQPPGRCVALVTLLTLTQVANAAGFLFEALLGGSRRRSEAEQHPET